MKVNKYSLVYRVTGLAVCIFLMHAPNLYAQDNADSEKSTDDIAEELIDSPDSLGTQHQLRFQIAPVVPLPW